MDQPTTSPTVEPNIVVEHREELIFLLREAAELEHMLMCEYLFAIFSLKRATSEGVTEAQLDAIRRWDRTISRVADQEMLHLTLACNLLTAVGAGPHFGRPNFPQYAKYYPPHVQVALLPFGEAALRHFVFLERPEGLEGEDAPEFTVHDGEARPVAAGPEVVPVAQSYATVGHLYRGIEAGLRRLVERYGEGRVFVGPPEAQLTQRYVHWPELIPVTDLATAQTAIDTIVEQGEGARGDWQEAHYGKFLSVLQEYLALKQQDPTFEPARPVVAARARPAVDVATAQERLLTDPITARVADVFNGAYEVTIQLLNRLFIHTEETEAELAVLYRAALGTMVGVLRPLGVLLSTLPVGAAFPGRTAGPSFAYYRAAYHLPHRRAAWIVMAEHLQALAEACADLRSSLSAAAGGPAVLTVMETKLREHAAALAQQIDPTPPPPESRPAAAGG
jgi:Ferritin-like